MGSARAGSNPVAVAFPYVFFPVHNQSKFSYLHRELKSNFSAYRALIFGADEDILLLYMFDLCSSEVIHSGTQACAKSPRASHLYRIPLETLASALIQHTTIWTMRNAINHHSRPNAYMTQISEICNLVLIHLQAVIKLLTKHCFLSLRLSKR